MSGLKLPSVSVLGACDCHSCLTAFCMHRPVMISLSPSCVCVCRSSSSAGVVTVGTSVSASPTSISWTIPISFAQGNASLQVHILHCFVWNPVPFLRMSLSHPCLAGPSVRWVPRRHSSLLPLRPLPRLFPPTLRPLPVDQHGIRRLRSPRRVRHRHANQKHHLSGCAEQQRRCVRLCMHVPLFSLLRVHRCPVNCIGSSLVCILC